MVILYKYVQGFEVLDLGVCRTLASGNGCIEQMAVTGGVFEVFADGT